MTNNRYDPNGILDDSQDVEITSPNDNAILQYNATSGQWENRDSLTISAGDITLTGSGVISATSDNALGSIIAVNAEADCIFGQSTNAAGVFGQSTNAEGVEGVSTGGIGVLGVSNTSYGVEGRSTTNHAGRFFRDSTSAAASMVHIQQSFSGDTEDLLTANNSGGEVFSISTLGAVTGSSFTDGTTTITGGNYTGVGNITGTDVDISAGTGDYTSTGDLNIGTGGIVLDVDSTLGTVGIGTAAAAGSLLRISKVDVTSTDSFNLIEGINFITATVAGKTYKAISFDTTLSLIDGVNVTNVSGIDNTIDIQAAGTQTVSEIFGNIGGVSVTAGKTTNPTVTDACAYKAISTLGGRHASFGTYCVYDAGAITMGSNNALDDGGITTAYMFRALAPDIGATSGLTIDTLYGLYLGDMADAHVTAPWSVYSLGGNMSHLGNARFGGVADVVPTDKLEVVGQSVFGDGGATNYTQIGATGNITQAGTAITTLDQLYLNEITTPTPVADDGAIYTKTDNALYFTDGDGAEHLVHGDAFSNLWFHDVSVSTITISASNTFVAITSFDDIGEQDDLGNLVSSTSTDDMTVGASGAGQYKATFHLSAGSGGAADEFIVVVGQTFATPVTISAATNATPIVCTSNGHGFKKGDMVTISGGIGNTAVDGDWFLKPVGTDTFTLLDLQGANSVGNGVYTTDSADVTILYHGNILLHRKLAQNELGTGGANADLQMATSDKLKLYVANVGGNDNIDFTIVNMEAKRIGD